MRYFIFLLFYTSLAWAQFMPIMYKYTNADRSDLSYLTKTEFLYVPYNIPSRGLIHYPDNNEFDETYIMMNPQYAASWLRTPRYELTTEQFMDYQSTHGLLGKMPAVDLQKRRQQSFNKANKILILFLNKYPSLRLQLESAPAYGVFEITSFNTLIYTGGFGSGMVFDKVKKTTEYVDTFRAGTGFGLGYISNYTLIIFHSHLALEQYIGAGGMGGDIGASGTAGIWNRSISFNPYISTYHIFNYGADVQVNWGGIMYWLSPSLN